MVLLSTLLLTLHLSDGLWDVVLVKTHQSGAIWGFIHYLGRQKGNVVLMLEEHWALSVGQFSFNVYFIGYIFFRAKYFGAAEALAFKVKKKC